MQKIVFVCHGNICRSVAAEMVFLYKAKAVGRENEFDVTSSATSLEEIGNPIYPPMRSELLSRGIPLIGHRAKRISKEEFEEADLVFYMDEENLYGLRRLFPNGYNDPKVKPIFAFSKGIDEIEDPWYSGRYSLVVDQIERCVDDILEALGK